MSRAAAVLTTGFGPLLVVIDHDIVGDRPAPVPGAVVASGFRVQHGAEPRVTPGKDDLLAFVADAVAVWDSGVDLAALDRVPVAPGGSGFRVRAWQALRTVPAGATISYRGLAELAGSAGAARAAGTACATNPVAPFVPCHRVVRADGAPGEYGYGVHVKQALLEHEGVGP